MEIILDDMKINSNVSIISQNISQSVSTKHKQEEPKQIEISENIHFEKAFRKAKQYVQINNTKLSLSYDKENNVPVIYVLDNETDEVIRRIPSEKLIELSGDEEKLKGFFFEEGV